MYDVRSAWDDGVEDLASLQDALRLPTFTGGIVDDSSTPGYDLSTHRAGRKDEYLSGFDSGRPSVPLQGFALV